MRTLVGYARFDPALDIPGRDVNMFFRNRCITCVPRLWNGGRAPGWQAVQSSWRAIINRATLPTSDECQNLMGRGGHQA